MTDLRIPRGQTATLDRVDGHLRIGNHATVQTSNGENVVVTGRVYLEGKAYVNGNLECDSVESESFLSEHREINVGGQRARLDLIGRYTHLEVNGNLTVHKQLSVSHSVEVKGAITASDIDVGGKIEADAVKCSRIRVGGRTEVKGMFEAESVDVGGKVEAGPVKIGDLNVGGEAEVDGGSITGNIRVGGRFISKSKLEFGELLVYGKGALAGGSKGRKVSAFGKLEADGDLISDVIEAGGIIEIKGDCHAQHVEIGGKLEVSGSLYVSERIEGVGSAEVEGNVETAHLKVSGKLEADRITAKEDADVSGKIEVDHGLKAAQVTVRSGSRCEGVLIGERVEVGKSADLSYGGWGKWGVGAMTRVDDIYAKEAIIGAMSTAGRIFANKITLEQSSSAWQVTYTDELKIAQGAGVSEQPRKVENLPKSPF